MLLRRITQHVKDQNWFAVFIDLVIVVVGVFIGIQVANWNEARNEEARQAEVLASILDDLRADHEILKNGLDMAAINIHSTNHLFKVAGLEQLNEVALPSASEVLSLSVVTAPDSPPLTAADKSEIWKRITIHYYPEQSDAALGALIAAGDLGLIKNQTLVRNLQRYKLLWGTLENSNDNTFRSFRNQAVFIGQELGLSPFAKISESELAKLLSENQNLVGAVRTLPEFTFLHHRQIENLYEQNLTLTQQIEESLTRKG